MMKKFSVFLIVMLACACGMAAQVTSVRNGMTLLGVDRETLGGSITHESLKAGAKTGAPKSAKAPAARRAPALSALKGYYYSTDYGTSTPVSVSRRYTVEVSITATDSVAFYNLMGGGRTVYGSYDATTGVIKVKPQVVYEDATYGAFYCYFVDWSKRLYYPDTELTFQVDEDGNISTGNWGAFVISGAYAGSQIVSSKSLFRKTNATITDYSLSGADGSNAVRTYPCLYVRESNTQIAVYNFYNRGTEVVLTTDSTGAVSMAHQVIATSSTTKYYNYVITSYTSASDVKLSSGSLSGTFSGQTITLGPWALSSSTATKYIVESLTKTEINTPETFSPFTSALTLAGSGTEADPYLITSAADLESLANTVNNSTEYKDSKGNVFTGKHFRQTADIDMRKVSNHQPVGLSGYSFNAHYDGQNHTISNLSQDRRNELYAGLFGLTGDDAVVENITLSSPSVNCTRSKVGTLIGENNGTVRNITVTGGYVGNAALYAGGIVGMNYGTVSGVSYSGTVEGEVMIGGIIGASYNKLSDAWSDATINLTAKTGSGGGICGSIVRDTAVTKNCYFVGTVTSSLANNHMGGIVGYVSKGNVEGCWNGGQVYDATTSSATGSTGGIVGHLIGGKVSNCYNSGIVRNYGGLNSGGLVGLAEKGTSGTVSETDQPTVTASLTTGNLICSPAAKGNELVGTATSLKINNSYYDNQACYNGGDTLGLSTSTLTSGNAISGFDSSIWKYTAGQYPQLSLFTGVEKAKLDAAPFTLAAGETVMRMKSAFTVSTINDVKWYLMKNGKLGTEGNGLKIEGNNVSVTAQKVVSDTLTAMRGNDFRIYIIKVAPDEFEGDGSAANPYLIKSFADIQKVKNAVDKELYDYTGVTLKLANDIDMTDAGSFYGLSVNGANYAFNGTFDGDGHSIKNWTVNRSFTAAGYASGTENLMAALFIYTGKDAVIKNLKIDKSCSIAGGSVVSSVVAYNNGTVSNCRNYAPVKGVKQYVAGIVAYNTADGTVSNCYNAGTVTAGSTIAGGVVGYNLGLLTLSQNDGAVLVDSLTSYVSDLTKLKTAGGVVALNGATVSNCANYGYVRAAGEVGGIVGSNASNTTITGVISGGVVETTNDLKTIGAVIGSTQTTNLTFANCYYDAQLTNENAANAKSFDGITALTTAGLVSGDTIEGISKAAWTFSANRYPVLTAFADEEASLFNSRSFVKFASGDKRESRFSVSSASTIVAPDGVTVSLARGSKFSISGNTLNLSGVTEAERDTITFTGGTMTKAYPLFASPKMLPGGDGSKSNPWQITSVADWDTVAKYSASYTSSFDGEYFILVNDLDFKQDTLTSLPLVGDGATQFQGYFNGNNKTIDGFKYENTDTKAGINKGLFGLVGGNAVIENLTLGANSSVTCYQYAGGFAGQSAGTMRNCVNKASVTTSKMGYAGGLVAYANTLARFYNCRNYGTVTDANNAGGGIAGSTDDNVEFDSCANYGEITAKYSAGGITGSAKANIRNCVNEGTIVSNSYNAGGIVGYSNGTEAVIADCVNRGTVTATTTYGAAGIIGNLYGQADVLRCKNYAAVYAKTSSAGGIIGQTGSTGGIVVDSCLNYGSVTTGTYSCGGIVGDCKKPSKSGNNLVSNCVNYGQVKSTTYRAGGITGENLGSNILRNNTNYGHVSGTYNVGGVTGVANDTVMSCMNAADIEGGYYLGGVVGSTSSQIVISSVANFGNVTTTSTTSAKSYGIGGVVGYGRATITDAYNAGDVTGYKQTAGIHGLPIKNYLSISRCYNLGTVSYLSDADAATCGIIYGGASMTGVKVDSVFYDKLVCTESFTNDSLATPLSTQELTKLNLGGAWTSRTDCYPVLTTMADSAVVKLYSAALVLAEGDTRQNVTKDFTVGMPEGISWTVSSNLLLDGGEVKLNGTEPGDKATLTASTGGTGARTLTYTITVNAKTTGIDATTNAGKEVERIEYIDMNGRRMSSLGMGVNIVRTVYTDGTTSTRKVVVSRQR